MPPIVSIIMGAYNAEKTLPKCIESILNQSFKDWEFIICDDCSHDSTHKILEEYSKKDLRLKIISNKKNMRLAASLNNCLKIARGKYVARMDADDESLPERLQVEVDYLEGHHEIDCVGCNVIVFDECGDKGIRGTQETPTKYVLVKSTPFIHPTIMMKKAVYDDLGGYTVSKNTMRAEDIDLWVRFFAKGYVGYNIQKNLYRYHESLDDYQKRTLKAAIASMKVYLMGYKVLCIPKYKYFFAIKPIISALIPNAIMHRYHNKQLAPLN